MAKYSLGIHIGHDRSASLVKDGVLVASIAEERLDRKKHSNSADIPTKSVDAIIKTAGIDIVDISIVGISYTSVNIERIVNQLKGELKIKYPKLTKNVHGFSHHLCHAYSAFYTCDLDNPIVIVADGAGDIVDNKLEAETVYVHDGDELKEVGKRLQDFGLLRTDRRNGYNMDYMHPLDKSKQISLGRKYEQLTYLIGFSHGQSGKTMGLAAGYDPLIKPKNIEINSYQYSLTFDDLLKEIHNLWLDSSDPWNVFISENRGRIAASAQALAEAYMIPLVKFAMKSENRKNICLAGGLFLNCTMNHKLIKECGLDNIHIIPAAGDDGQSIGAAFAAYKIHYGEPERSANSLPYLGKKYTESDIQYSMNYFGLYGKKMDDEWLAEQIAKDIDNGLIIGMLRGRSEVGPRALGHRSILANPNKKGIQDCLNIIKGRELFRPFAPMTTWEGQFEYFNLDVPSPHMLFATSVKDKYSDVLPGITHVDGSARVQAVQIEKEPFLHLLLESVHKVIGYPILLNTSFNLAGDPIVESPHDAIATFLSSGLDRLVIDSYYIENKSAIRKL